MDSCGLKHSCSVPSALLICPPERDQSSESPHHLSGMWKAGGQRGVTFSRWLHGDLVKQFLQTLRGKELHLQRHSRRLPHSAEHPVWLNGPRSHLWTQGLGALDLLALAFEEPAWTPRLPLNPTGQTLQGTLSYSQGGILGFVLLLCRA